MTRPLIGSMSPVTGNTRQQVDWEWSGCWRTGLGR